MSPTQGRIPPREPLRTNPPSKTAREITIRLSEQSLEQLEIYADRKKQTKSEVIEELIQVGLFEIK